MNFSSNESSNFWSSSSSSPLFFQSDKKETTVLNSSVPVRLAFLRKVYGILSVQLAMTTLISASIMFMPTVQGFIIQKYIFNMYNYI
jgi:FtsH-binding integral membrane protein